MDLYRERLQRLERRLERIDVGAAASREGMAGLLHVLQRAEERIEGIVPAIHDLWSRHLITRGVEHPLVKPYEEMTEGEAAVERALAGGDLRGIRRVIRRRHPGLVPAPAEAGEVQAAVFGLARDDEFVAAVAPLVHEEWRRVKAGAGFRGDPRLALDFADMPAEQARITLDNVRHDVLALALYVEPRVVCTAGHGARTIEAFLEILVEAGIDTLVDVRRFPGSRRHPQFGREALAAAVEGIGVRYTWEGETLGGRRHSRAGSRHTALRNPAFAAYADHMDTPALRAAIDARIAAAVVERAAVMCAETLWWHCHRMLVADALTMRGAVVEHLLEPGTRQPHRLTEGVRRDDDGWPVYDAQPVLPGL